MQKIPATVITGFLGAGKTTLIRHMLANAGGRRIALVINEFGDLGVDREMVLGCGIEGCEEGDVVELSNGCICCTVADDFLPVMERLVHQDTPPDHIVIETSGLALPKPLIRAFNWPEIRAKVTVDGVVAVVDGPAYADGRFADDPASVQQAREADDALDHDNPLEEVFTDQILSADMILLNKSDLLGDDVRDDVRSALRSCARAGVHVVTTAHGNVDIDVLLGQSAAAETDLASRPSHHDDHGDEHDHDDFESFVVELDALEDIDGLLARLNAAAQAFDILRIKGFIHVPTKPMRLAVQGVGTRFQHYFDRPWADGEMRTSKLVVIGLKGMARDDITRAIVDGKISGNGTAAA